MNREKSKAKMKIGKRYFLDGQKDITGLYVGQDDRNHYLFGALTNNYLYIRDDKGFVPMPANAEYELTDDLVTIIKQ